MWFMSQYSTHVHVVVMQRCIVCIIGKAFFNNLLSITNEESFHQNCIDLLLTKWVFFSLAPMFKKLMDLIAMCDEQPSSLYVSMYLLQLNYTMPTTY